MAARGVLVLAETDRAVRHGGVGDAGVRVQADALARLLESLLVASDRAVARGQVRAGNEVARIGLLPELQHLDGPVAVVEHVHVVARRDVEPLALAHPVAELERPL